MSSSTFNGATLLSCAALPPVGVILVADAVPLLRQGLVQVLAQAHAGYCLLQAGTTAELLLLTQQLSPALVLTAADLPGAPPRAEGLLTALREIKPDLPVVALTDPVATPEPDLLRLLRHNVSGLLARSASISEVSEMVSSVLQRGRFYNEATLRLLQSQLAGRPRPARLRTELSNRQLEVLQLIAEEYCNEEIAGLLSTSVRTVEYHRSQMLQKTGTRTTLGLVLYALRQGVFVDKALS
ncbi:response regulator transcription factor [Hymenobacter lucidus]|uniref:Response regulator transcription factor n=1 Tax=Hymenobacter lucidus TaxID=2880930 RepID=A0ABS8AMN6_9BACT|nr:response regulator transcription factor [Hymenobacter lucidus]MCB2407475.1 response regulator transcription factor [Hymenobacter lucidus]